MNQPSDIPSVEFLETNGFSMKLFSDGIFWLRYFDDDIFIQLNEARDDITTYKRGRIEDWLTFDELKDEIRSFDTGDLEEVLWEM